MLFLHSMFQTLINVHPPQTPTQTHTHHTTHNTPQQTRCPVRFQLSLKNWGRLKPVTAPAGCPPAIRSWWSAGVRWCRLEQFTAEQHTHILFQTATTPQHPRTRTKPPAQRRPWTPRRILQTTVHPHGNRKPHANFDHTQAPHKRAFWA